MGPKGLTLGLSVGKKPKYLRVKLRLAHCHDMYYKNNRCTGNVLAIRCWLIVRFSTVYRWCTGNVGSMLA
jgi:hypothetical protein